MSAGIMKTIQPFHLIPALALMLALCGEVHAVAIRTWLVCGPFAGSLEKEFITNEKGAAPKAWATAGGKQWKISSSPSQWIDLGSYAVFESTGEVSAYAYTELYSDRAVDARLLLGSSGELKVWLNGTLILRREDDRVFTPNQDKLRVQLVQGQNRLLVKTKNAKDDFLLSCSVTDLEGNNISSLRFMPEQENLFRLPVRKLVYSSAATNDPVRFNPLFLLDGLEDTSWAAANSNNQWIALQMREETQLTRLALWWGASYATSYVIEAAHAPGDWRTVYKATGREGGKEDIILPQPVSGKYVRIRFLERSSAAAGPSLSEMFLFGPSKYYRNPEGESINTVLMEEDKTGETKTLRFVEYPSVVRPGESVFVTVEWNNAPPAAEYDLVVQIENLDMLPPVFKASLVENYPASGKKTVIVIIPEDIPRFEGYRFVAAFISKTKGWDDMYAVTNTARNVRANEQR